MSKFITLLKFEFLSNGSRNKDDKLFSRIKKILLTLLGIGCIVGILLYAINVIMKVFLSANMEHEFIIYFTALMMILHLVMGIAMSTKTLFMKVDLSILKLPIDGKDIFFSKLIYLYTKQLFFSLIISLPVFIMFGVYTMQSEMFYLMLRL